MSALIPADWLKPNAVVECTPENMGLALRAIRKIVAYEQALSNIETIIDGKADASLEEGRYQSNDYGQIQSAIDEARR